MPVGSSAKILAKLIKMYRAAYVAAAGASTGSTNISQAIMRIILGQGKTQPKVNLFAGKKAEDIIKIFARGFQK